MIDFKEGYILSIDKPYTWTSADVVRKVKTLLRTRAGLKKIKVGHAGTLDPLATGLLIVCIGKATKNIDAIQRGEKEYVADIRFGTTTPSLDLETEPDGEYPYKHITAELIQTAFDGFLGEQEQIPPLFSAKLINGKRAYEYARTGETPEIKPAKIVIHSLELLNYCAPTATVRIRCSRGTYIRSFARDLGLALQSGACLSALRRTASGSYNVANALIIDDLEMLFSTATDETD
ncbi:MAG: tRNA pseudouridine(55) synthase TruB [Prevotellaceae bacterium]|jgi:tRNA pseudouridine55 synthase|nr:tRNA pseudouridine(55) synthase TruB [Prevotellaceae bacterium]